MKAPLISILTVTYNSEKFINDFANSIILTSEFKTGLIEVLIWDANSRDGTKNKLKKFKKFHIHDGKNLGFCKANNKLAKNARGDWLFFLNPDAKLDNKCLRELIAHLDKADILIPLQRDFNRHYLSCGNGMDVFGFSYWFKKRPRKFFYGDGAAFLIKKEIFKNFGGFDENYFMFQEEIDLQWKAHLQNKKFLQIPRAVVYHFGGGSITGGALKNDKIETTYERRYLGERNIITNILKNYQWYNLIWILFFYFLINLFEIIFFVIILKPKVSLQYIKAWKWNWNIKNHIWKERKKIHKLRILGDREIFSNIFLGSKKLNLLIQNGIPRIK